jgi:ABC-type phosphate transport system substrate-binding protein
MSVRTLTLLASLLVLLAESSASAGEPLAVIVCGDRGGQLTVEEVAQIYLKQRRFWDDGAPVVAVNRNAGSQIRSAFTRRVFGDRARRLAIYWNRQYFQGVLPPATLASDEAVKRFVALEPNAIGYIRASQVDDSVSVLLYLDPP